MDRSITITVGTGKPMRVAWVSGMNVQQALEAAYNEIRDPSRFNFALQFYGTYQDSPLGYMVVMLDGVYDLPSQHRYWAMLVNGTPATKGIDLTILSPDDAVTFINEPYSEEKHHRTAVAIKHQHYRSSMGGKAASPDSPDD